MELLPKIRWQCAVSGESEMSRMIVSSWRKGQGYGWTGWMEPWVLDICSSAVKPASATAPRTLRSTASASRLSGAYKACSTVHTHQNLVDVKYLLLRQHLAFVRLNRAFARFATRAGPVLFAQLMSAISEHTAEFYRYPVTLSGAHPGRMRPHNIGS